jgi:hypothetical protein
MGQNKVDELRVTLMLFPFCLSLSEICCLKPRTLARSTFLLEERGGVGR